MSIDFPTDVLPGQTDLDGNTAPEPPAPPPDEITVRGTTQLGLHGKGGKTASRSTVTVSGVKAALFEQEAFEKGETVRFLVTCRIVKVAEVDKVDKPSGVTMECVQEHTATATDVELYSS